MTPHQIIAMISTVIAVFATIAAMEHFEEMHKRNRSAIIICVALTFIYLFTLPPFMLLIPVIILFVSIVISHAID